MSTQELLKVAKKHSNTSFTEAEFQISNLVNKRPSFAKLDMSKPNIMGVINITPDSFYKNSQIDNLNKLKKYVYKMINNGASIIDIGGESSRPGAEKISSVEEINRVIDPIKYLKNCKVDTFISLDSRNL